MNDHPVMRFLRLSSVGNPSVCGRGYIPERHKIENMASDGKTDQVRML